MTTKIAKVIFTFALLGLSYQPLLAQEDILKEKVTGKLERHGVAFYASTLRMINLTNNEEYDEMVSGIDKLLIYMLDSATQADKSYRSITQAYREEGFEEYAMANGGALNMSILGHPKRGNQLVGYFANDDICLAFYLKGDIAWEKIPKLMTTMKDLELMDLLKDKKTKF